MKSLLVKLLAFTAQVVATPLAATSVNDIADVDLQLAPNTVGTLAVNAGGHVNTKRDAQGADKKIIVKTTISRQKQYVGQYSATSSTTLSKAISDALQDLCPAGGVAGSHCSGKTKDVEGVAYKAHRNEGAYNNDVHFSVRAYVYTWPEAAPGLRETLIQYVAGAFEIMMKDEKNCFYQDLDNGERRERFCNVAKWVEVTVGNPTDETKQHDRVDFGVEVLINGQDHDGSFDCPAILDAIDDFARKNVLESIQTALIDESKDSQWYTASTCSNADDKIGKENHLNLVSNAVRSPLIENYVYTTIGNQKQYVGQYSTTSKTTMWMSIYANLYDLCPYKNAPSQPCWINKEKLVNGVSYYAKSKNGKLSDNAHFSIKITEADWVVHSPTRPASELKDTVGIGPASFHHIADMYTIMTMDDKNCFYKKFGITTAPQRYCNVARWVHVLVRDPKTPQTWGKFNVSVEFNTESEDGEFDCVAILEAAQKSTERKSLFAFKHAVVDAQKNSVWRSEISCPNRTVDE